MKHRILPCNPKLKERARQLRQNMTLAEVLLWKRLNRKQLLGFDFDRQRPIDEFIVDFFCKELCLAIEVDGRSHDFKQAPDARRQKALEELGVHFLRFWDTEIKNNIESVLRRIEEWIQKNPPRPLGTPPKEGI